MPTETRRTMPAETPEVWRESTIQKWLDERVKP